MSEALGETTKEPKKTESEETRGASGAGAEAGAPSSPGGSTVQLLGDAAHRPLPPGHQPGGAGGRVGMCVHIPARVHVPCV